LRNAEATELSKRARALAAGSATLAAPDQCLVSLTLLAPATQPFRPRLSPQQLVDLLKQPLVVGAARRIVLDSLEVYYHRQFADQWAFVRFAQEQGLDLDFTSPPQRPEMPAAAGKP
jgi:hypothetical protein